MITKLISLKFADGRREFVTVRPLLGWLCLALLAGCLVQAWRLDAELDRLERQGHANTAALGEQIDAVRRQRLEQIEAIERNLDELQKKEHDR